MENQFSAKHAPYIREVPGATCAVLMIHGIVSTPRHFDWLIPTIADSYSIYNILLDGHGGNVRDFAETSMKKWRAQVRAMLETLSAQYESIIIVGFSMGTLLAIDAAPHYPKVKALMLLNPPLRPRVQPRMLPMSFRFAMGKPVGENRHEAAFRADTSVTLTPKLWQYYRWVPRFVELLQLSHDCRKVDISVPCFAYLGGVDELVSPRSARYFRNNPLVTLRIFPEAGHFLYPAQDKQQISADLQSLLKDIQ